MLNFIKSMDIFSETKPQEIYDYYKTLKSEENVEIINNINQFTNLKEFFDYYTNHDSKTIFDFIIQLKQKISKILDTENSITHFNSNINQYISILTKFILVIKIIIEIEKNLHEILINSKNYLTKLTLENDIINNNINLLLNDYHLNKLNHFTFNKKDYLNKKGLPFSSNNIFFSKNLSQPNLKSKNNKKYQSKLLSGYKIRKKFKSNKISEFNSRKSSKDFDFELKNKSILPISEFCIDKKEDLEEKNNLNKTNRSIKEIKEKISKTEELERKLCSARNVCNFNNIEICMELLEMINNIYNREIIGESEKIKLKKLVIIKSNKLVKFYKKVYKNNYNNSLKLKSEINKLIQ